MAFGSVTLQPGVNVERTPMALRAGFSTSSLIRFRDSLVQKLGGWLRYYTFALAGVPRDMHAWKDLNGNKYLAVGTTARLDVISNGVLSDITPQTLISDFAPNVSTTATSNVVSITDPNATDVSVLNSILFNTPLSIGGLILFGLFPINQTTGTNSYEIIAPENATTTETNPTATNNTTAAGNNTLHFGTTPAWVLPYMALADLTTPAAIPAGTYVSSSTGTTIVMSANAAGAGVGNGDEIVIASIPVFITTSGSQTVTVKFIAHGLSVGETFVFQIPTTHSGVTISGAYEVASVVDANTFAITANTQATGSATFAMNSGDLELEYFIALGPPAAGAGFGLGGFGSGGFGTGIVGGSLVGTEITATDWTSDNWGEILVACPENGGIYYWDPTSGFANAQIISTPMAPAFNAGIFVSTSAQILIAYGSSVARDVGLQQQSLLVQWSDDGNFLEWRPLASTQAGNFTIPIGSALIAGLAVSNQNLLFTDLDLWAMNYIGPPDVFGFNKIGAGLGAVSSHAVQQLRGSVFWMAPTNFCSYTGAGANVVPCPVWDAVFQNINTDFLQNVRAMPNTPFNEVGWLYPSGASVSGECDSYVKMNITEPGTPWDYGPMNVLPRSAWIDQTVLGMPIGASPNGFVYQHETSPDGDGSPVMATFTTGFFYLEEGEQFVVVDQVLPDFKWTTFPGGTSAQIQLTFNVVDYPGDTPRVYGPYTVTSATEFISVRFRGRLMSITVASTDLGSFWRIGSIKYRYQPGGRR